MCAAVAQRLRCRSGRPPPTDAVQQALIHALLRMQVTDSALVVGAAVTLSRLQARLKELVAAGAPHETGVFAALLEQLRYFAGVQIRNVATVGGCVTRPNTCCASARSLCSCRAFSFADQACLKSSASVRLFSEFLHSQGGSR